MLFREEDDRVKNLVVSHLRENFDRDIVEGVDLYHDVLVRVKVRQNRRRRERHLERIHSFLTRLVSVELDLFSS